MCIVFQGFLTCPWRLPCTYCLVCSGDRWYPDPEVVWCPRLAWMWASPCESDATSFRGSPTICLHSVEFFRNLSLRGSYLGPLGMSLWGSWWSLLRILLFSALDDEGRQFCWNIGDNTFLRIVPRPFAVAQGLGLCQGRECRRWWNPSTMGNNTFPMGGPSEI